MADFKTSAERQAHWEKVYSQKGAGQDEWDHAMVKPSLDLIQQANLDQDDRILDLGAGKSPLIKNLLEKGYTNLLAADISDQALAYNKQQTGVKAEKVTWLVDDVTNPQKLHELDHVALWHDRGVFHYITDFKERLSYFSLMNRVVREEGYVILAASGEGAAETQAGLPVRTYNLELMRSFMGPGYYVVDNFQLTEPTPNGADQPMLYALFKRVPYVTMR